MRSKLKERPTWNLRRKKASRRFGGISILQGDLVRHLSPNQVGVLCLFFDEQMQPEVGRYIGWNELQKRQEKSNLISKSARFSPTFLDAVMQKR